MTTLCYIDTETTGLDARVHQPYEVSWWFEDEPGPMTMELAHELTHADQQALKIGGYFDRGFHRSLHGGWVDGTDDQRGYLAGVLHGVTLVGSNPAFDAAMLTRYIGAPVWHHRLIDVSNVAMTVFDTDRPMGLAEVREWLLNGGHEIPEPDHTAEGDVRATRAVYEALRAERRALR